jgi:hypothetical protein
MAVRHGYSLIADISGYTHYLSASELDHAEKILTTLLDLLIAHTRPPLIISRLAGDAVISYGLDDSFLQPQTFLESIEDTYVSFRRQIELMVRNTTCTCNACRNIGALDLKFFVHHGEFGVQKLGGHDELVGSDVNLIHRLLKNHVTERTGLSAYALYTTAAATILGLDPGAPDLVALEEEYEHLGRVEILVKDMHPVWQARRHDMQVVIPSGRALFSVATDIALPREPVWDYLLQPAHYNVLVNATRIAIVDRSHGRVGVGSSFQCYHGDSIVPLAVVDWQPFQRTVTQADGPLPIMGVVCLVELKLETIPAGTRLTQTMGRATGPLVGRLMCDAIFGMQKKTFKRDMDNFRDHVEADWRALAGSAVAAPPPPASVTAAIRESLGA